jgi:hypothetical protein
MTRTQTNVLHPLRWSLDAAEIELGISRKTLQRRLADSEIVAAEDGYFTTTQLVTAISGDYKAQKLRKLKAESQLIETKQAVLNKTFLPAATVERSLVQVFGVIKSEILGDSTLSEDAKRSLLSHLADVNVEP